MPHGTTLDQKLQEPVMNASLCSSEVHSFGFTKGPRRFESQLSSITLLVSLPLCLPPPKAAVLFSGIPSPNKLPTCQPLSQALFC